MDIRHLKIFIAVAETGSMHTAANLLYLSQPSVSQAIRDLENHYQVLLFERLSRKLYITERGQQLLTYAYQVVEQFHALEESMHNKRSASTLRIGASIAVGTYLLTDILPDFEKEHPETEIFSQVSNTDVIEDKLLKSQLDVAIVKGNIKSPDLVCKPIVHDRLVLACGKDHPFYKRNTLTSTELNDQRFAISEKGSGTRELFEQYLEARNISIKVYLEANCPQTIINSIIRNNTLAVISSRLMLKEILNNAIKIFQFRGIEWDRNFHLVYHKNKHLTNEIATLERLLTEYTSEKLPNYQSAHIITD